MSQVVAKQSEVCAEIRKTNMGVGSEFSLMQKNWP